MAAATLEQEMGRRSVAEAIRPIREREVASSSSAERAITQEMVAEACDTLVRERHPASPPVWPESSGIPAESQLRRTGETRVLTEPPLPQRKSASTPRPQRDGSPREAERKPEPAVFSPSPVVEQEQPLPMRTHVPETEESESDASNEPGPKEDPPHLMARPALDLEGDQEAAELDQEEAGGAEQSAQIELAILNGLDISSLPALRDLSTRASTTVHIPWPPVGMERATPEWRQKASQAMAFLLGGRGGEHYGSWSDALRQRPECRLDPPDTTQGEGYGLPECTTARSAGCWMDWSPRGPRDIESRRLRDEECFRSRNPPEGAPGQMEHSPRRGIEERRSQRQASPMESSSAALEK